MRQIPFDPQLYMDHNYPEHWPTEANDFIGDARAMALRLEGIVKKSVKGGYSPIKIFLSGFPGIGKSALLKYLLHLTGCQQFAVQSFSGVDVSVDIVREVSNSLHLCVNDLFGPFRFIVIEEADKIPLAAQVRLLDLLDKAPRRTIVFCTSNKSVKDLEVRFQGRFMFSELNPPTHAEVIELLGKWEITGQLAQSIAITANGSVRMALLEASEHLACCV